MLINENKTKTMIFNETKNYKFSTRRTLNGSNIDIIPEKILRTITTDNLSWNSNTSYLMKKANARNSCSVF